jgi:hypothetical protein
MVLSGCAVFSTPGVDDDPPAPIVERPTPADPTEALLQRLGSLPAGQPVSVDDQVWIPGRVYSAASGRQCRLVDVETRGVGSEARLACRPRDGGGSWDWYPVVAP